MGSEGISESQGTGEPIPDVPNRHGRQSTPEVSMWLALLLGAVTAPAQYSTLAATAPASGNGTVASNPAAANGKDKGGNGSEAKDGNGADEEPQPKCFFGRLIKAYCDEFFPKHKEEDDKDGNSSDKKDGNGT